MNHQEFFRQFGLGAYLGGEPMPPLRELIHAMQILKRSGFNLVNLQTRRMTGEPLEGRLDSSIYEEWIEEAARLDLAVCVYLDFEPAPGAPEDQRRYLTRLVETLGKHENVVAWNIGQAANPPGDLAEAIRAADPLQRPVFAQPGGFEPAGALDFQGAACYPARAPFHPWDDAAPRAGRSAERAATLLHEAAGVALTFDTLRSCNPPGAPLWAAEFQGGPLNGFLHLGRTPDPADIRRWMLSAASSGVTAISFRASGGEGLAAEPGGIPLLDGTGESTPRLREAARVGAALQRHADLFAAASWGGAEVGILADAGNAQICAAHPPAGEHLAYSTRGWHRLLWELGVPLDFVNAEQVSEETARQYKMLILPFPISLSEEIAQKLGAYVYAGGGLVSEAVPGRLDERGVPRRGEISPIFANLFGVSQVGLSVVREPGSPARWTPPERGWGEFLEPATLQGDGPLEGYRLPASLFVQTFECQGSQPVLKYHSRAAGAFRVGRLGWAWLLGTCVGHSALAHRSPDTLEFVRNLLAQCKVQPLHTGRLLVRKRAIPGKRAWFFTNPTDETITEEIWVGGAQVEDLFGQPLERRGEHVSLSVEGLDVRVLIASDR